MTLPSHSMTLLFFLHKFDDVAWYLMSMTPYDTPH
jgi:hypothetical protein